jgi:hypothetical protein
MDQLKTKIKNLRRKNAARHSFVPELSFYSVMTEDAVRSVLTSWPPYHRDEIAQKIIPRGRKIFGILILLGQIELLSKFVEIDQLEDAKLPFRQDTLVQDIHLSPEEARDFHEKQWELTAPTFARGTLNRRFDVNTVMPFVENREVGEGCFGKVCEVMLRPDHQELGDNFPPKVRLTAQCTIRCR